MPGRTTAESPADGVALAPRIRAALERARLEPADRAHPRGRRCEVRQVADHVTKRCEPLANIARDPPFDREHARFIRVRVEGPWERSRYDARCLDRGLQVHLEIDDVADRLDHRLTLRVLAGAPEWHERPSVLHQQRRIRREPWTLARRDRRW